MKRALLALRSWLRRRGPAPPPPQEPLPPEPPAEPRPSGGPYREAAEVPPKEPMSWPAGHRRFAGFEILETDRSLPGCVRHLVLAPERAGGRLSVACFDAKTVGHDQFFAMRFDEAGIYTRLRHPRLARVLELGHDEEGYWYLSEYPAGVTLARRLREAPRVPLPGLDIVRTVFADVAEGLHHAHTVPGDDGAPFGWVYRSLTPHAILLGEDGRGTVVDWGLEVLCNRSAHEGRATGVLKGKIGRYLSPEHMKGEVVDGRSDVFSLGAMLYEASTGRKPFDGDGDLDIVRSVLRRTPLRSPSEVVPGYPPDLERLVLRALALDPASRPTAGELSDGLRALR
jgi:serine/threonine protein kinase